MSIATTRVSLTGTDWTDLGAGPLQVQAAGAPLTLALADMKPAAGDPGFQAPLTTLLVLQTTSHVWAKTAGGAVPAGAVILAPVSAAGGGGGSGGGGAVTIADGADVAQGASGDAAGINSVIGQLKGILAKLGATVLGAGSAVIGKVGLQVGGSDVAAGNAIPVNAALAAGSALVGKVGIDQTTPGTSNGVVAGAGENHIGEIGGNSVVALASQTRPANTTAYAAGQLVANATAAGSVASLTLACARKSGGTGRVLRARLASSNTGALAAVVRVHLYKTSPTTTVGDGGIFAGATNGIAAVHIGYFDITLDRQFSDGAKGTGTSATGSFVTFDVAAGSQNLYALLEARSAYTPTSGETFTLALEVDRD